MQFEFDANKSASNKQKHGMNFIDAQALWDDWDLLEIPAKAVEDEGRCLVIGKIVVLVKNHENDVPSFASFCFCEAWFCGF